jgi:hypothetical protein
MKLNAYLSKYSGLDGRKLNTYTQDRLAADLFITAHTFTTDADYTLVGHVEVTGVELLPRDAVIAARVATLRAEVQQTRAESEAKVTALERQINSLLAIEDCTAEAADEAQP